jgi:hypothetical protein
MYFSEKIVFHSYKFLGNLTDGTGKKAIEVTSALRYLFAVSSLIKKYNLTNGIDLSTNKITNRSEFISEVGDVVSLSDNIHYTANFIDDFQTNKDYAVRNNFLTTVLKDNRKQPGRPAPIFDVNNEVIKILPNIKLTLEQDYHNFKIIKSSMCIWLLRNKNIEIQSEIKSISEVYEIIDSILKERYDILVYESIKPTLQEFAIFIQDSEVELNELFVISKTNTSKLVKEKSSQNILVPISFTQYLSTKQTIYYGCPGTGKSKTIEKETEGVSNEFIFRTTFHPEYDYASFVGSYKPIMVSHEGTTPSVSYDFVPQVFTQAYVSAIQNPEQAHYLIIEEINRGNCALIFGDIFQLLDRQAGVSEYVIRADRDLEHYLSDVLKEKYQNTEGVRLPANLSILATMNTSDQSLFPMDSAFKRRWDWIYIPIDYKKANDYRVSVNQNECYWGDFLKTINAAVLGITESEDKQLGTFFVKPVDGFISETQLINKVMFYLWSDIFKNEDKNSPHYLFKYLKDGVEESFNYNQLHTEEKSLILEGFFKKWEINCMLKPPMVSTD